MKALELYTRLEEAMGPRLKSKEIDKGGSFFWEVERSGPNSTRILRVREGASGNIAEIKLSVSSLRTKAVTILPLPVTIDDVVLAARGEIGLLTS